MISTRIWETKLLFNFYAHRLSFSSPLRCKLWQERITECLRRIIKEPKAAFAFIHRAYNKDEKMARQDQLRRSVEGDVGGVDWDGPGEELDEERELVNGGNAPLLSLKGTMSQINSIRHMCTYIMYYACLCQLQKVCHVLHLLSIESQLFQFSP